MINLKADQLTKNGNVYTKECLRKSIEDQPKIVKLNRWCEVTKKEIYNAMLMPGEYKEKDGKFYIKQGMLDGLICDEINEEEVKTVMVNDAIDLFPNTEETKFERAVAESIDYDKIKKARKTMRKAFDSDEQLKWGYICNIAMHLYDEICKDGLELDYDRRNEIAKKMLKVIFYLGEE